MLRSGAAHRRRIRAATPATDEEHRARTHTRWAAKAMSASADELAAAKAGERGGTPRATPMRRTGDRWGEPGPSRLTAGTRGGNDGQANEEWGGSHGLSGAGRCGLFIAFAWPATAAAAGPPPGIHDALRLEMLSGPARYVSGGAARVRVVVPATVPLADATVRLNGADVTSSFAPDDRAPHALEGVLRGPAARREHRRGDRAGPGRSANDRTTLSS